MSYVFGGSNASSTFIAPVAVQLNDSTRKCNNNGLGSIASPQFFENASGNSRSVDRREVLTLPVVQPFGARIQLQRRP